MKPSQKEWKAIIRFIKKGDERGITLSACLTTLENYMKLYINNRITSALKMTNCQGGGKNGVSTAGHIKKLSTYIKNMKKRKKTV